MYIFNTRSRVVVCAFAVIIAASPLIAAADSLSQLSGKNLGENRELVNSVMAGRNYAIEVGKHGEIKQVLDAGAKGSGKDALSEPDKKTVVAKATAEAESEVMAAVDMPANYQGQSAVDFIGEDLSKIAARHGLAEDKLKELFLTDNSIRIDSNKHIFYVEEESDDTLPASESIADELDAEAASVVTGNALPIDTAPVTADAFKLHSKPGASKTIFIDFDGYTAAGTAWSATTIQAPAFDLDGNPAVFSDAERNTIISTWSRVAEDYSPFDVDVTTEQPADAALIRASSSDTVYGTRVVVTKKGTVTCSCGGIAYVGVVSMVNNTRYQPAWIFHDSLANSEKYMAEAIAHEAGHTLGLFHDGQKATATTAAVGYYSGHGTGVTGWASIMGVGYYKNLSQWSKGEYPNANNLQDDFAVLATNGFVPRADDAGNTLAAATVLGGTSSTVQKSGVIGSSSDVDMFRVDTAGGTFNMTVKPVAVGPNFDAALTLYNASGAVIATHAPETDVTATISTTLASGTYYVAVKGSAHAAAGTDFGYSTYGSTGQYLLTGSYAPASGAPVTAPVISSADSGASTPAAPATPTTSTTTAKVFASSLKIKVTKGKTVTVKLNGAVVDENNRPVPNALVKGTWSGAFSGNVGSTSAAKGEITQVIRQKAKSKGGSATFTLTSIEISGYTYSPDRNARSVATVSW